MSMMAGIATRVRDDRSATEKASSVAGKVSNLLSRVNDLKERLGCGSGLLANAVEKMKGYDAPPAPMPLLHDSLDEASATVDRINEVLDTIGQRL